MIIALAAIFILAFIIKDCNSHAARAFAAAVFTSMFYGEIIYTAFAFITWLLLLTAAYYLKRNAGNASRGALAGFLGSLIAYYAAPLI